MEEKGEESLPLSSLIITLTEECSSPAATSAAVRGRNTGTFPSPTTTLLLLPTPLLLLMILLLSPLLLVLLLVAEVAACTEDTDLDRDFM
jgi:hypothetical protein